MSDELEECSCCYKEVDELPYRCSVCDQDVCVDCGTWTDGEEQICTDCEGKA